MKLNSKSVLLGLMILSVSPVAYAQKKAQTSTLPIRHGYYAIAPHSCAFAVREGVGMYFPGRDFEFMDGVSEITSVTRRSSTEYKLTERIEDESGKYHKSTTIIRTISPTSFTRTLVGKDSGTYRFCSTKKPKDWHR